MLQLSAERIVVHLNLFRVFLFRDGKRVFNAPIAIGMPGHPTPTGNYEVISKIENPTWVPPNSPWAAGLEPMPPGAEQPARHTLDRHERARHRLPRDAAWTARVGHAASHGCMRMHRADVERIYDLVRVGTPVEIQV